MAQRRMLAQTIVESDAFIDMPFSAQALYLHLNMQADDDGFLNNPRKIQRSIGAEDEDLELLKRKKFLLGFDDGVVVVKHWKINNFIRKDTYNKTKYQEEFDLLELDENNAYRFRNGTVTEL